VALESFKTPTNEETETFLSFELTTPSYLASLAHVS
jgi:hypothetical protein